MCPVDGLPPILEFDPAREAMVEPALVSESIQAPEACVICFFREVIQQIAGQPGAAVLTVFEWEDAPHPLYEIPYAGRRLAFFHPGVGAPVAAGLLEEVIVAGCRKFIACGGSGVLERGVPVGELVVVEAAVRDEGLSYHYLPPARDVSADPRGLKALETTLRARGVPFRRAKTWTTDAPYRETRARVAARQAEGCLTVEMEAAALMAVAQFRGVPFGQLLYAGDDLSGQEWDRRDGRSQPDIRRQMFWLAAEACLAL
jgi:uridine phosphorylase